MSENSKEDIKEEKPQKTCFVIMPISDVDGYEKGHFGRVYEYLIKPACEAAGYKVDRADDTSKTNMIIVDILQKAVKYDMAICDISSRNANVFYELGFRQAFNMKTVLIKDKKTIMPFDISSIRTLSYNETLRIDEVEKGRAEIQKALEETEKSDSNDVNSLINLLSITKAEIPKQQELSPDTNILLNVLSSLTEKVNIVSSSLSAYKNTGNNYNELKKGNIVSYIHKGKEILGRVIQPYATTVLINTSSFGDIIIPKDIISDIY